MELDIRFTFRNKTCNCRLVIDISESPYYIFTIQEDREIIDMFTDDVSIKTDMLKVLPKEDDFINGIVELRQAIFNAFAATPEYQIIKAQVSSCKAKNNVF